MCFGFVVLKLPYGTLAEVLKLMKIVLGFAVLELLPKVCAHFLEARTKKSLFETTFFTKIGQIAWASQF